MASSSSGLTLLPKLTCEHIHLTSCSKMRVDLATQVYRSACVCKHINRYIIAIHYTTMLCIREIIALFNEGS